MINRRLAEIFYQMSEYYAMAGASFKPQAYERAARLIESAESNLADIYQAGGFDALMKIDGVGRSIAEKIEEFIKTGRIGEYIKLRKACPVDLANLTLVQGLGPKSIKTLYKKLRVKTLADLEKAAKAGKIAGLPRFGVKIQNNILRGIAYVKSGQGRILLDAALSLARKIEIELKKIKGVGAVMVAGSVRRRRETIGDLDVLVAADNAIAVMDFFCALPETEKILAKGIIKSSVILRGGVSADLRVVPAESLGAALQYFTGNKDHNIALRKIAENNGRKLNEYGLFQTLKGKNKEKRLAGGSEREIYHKLGLQYIEPEMRENTGEIELARENKLPELVKEKEVLGDLHVHSSWSDGADSIIDMAEAAKKLGRQYIAVTDHAGQLAVARGLKEKELLKQIAAVDEADKKISGLKIFRGAEVDIDRNGALSIRNEVLIQLDVVLGAIHDNFKMSKEAMTERICRAMANPQMHIWAHPSGRLLGRREGYEVDWERVFAQAAATGTVIEINAFPDRLDLDWQNVKRAIAAGVKISIGTDAHSINHLGYLELGVAAARRGWAGEKDIVNCWDWEDLRRFFKNKKYFLKKEKFAINDGKI